jgi:hypothetical protein
VIRDDPLVVDPGSVYGRDVEFAIATFPMIQHQVEWSGATSSIVVTVRREKPLDYSGCNSRPGTGSLHPVEIEATAEATRLLEPSV